MRKFAILVLVSFFIFPFLVLAKVGVGFGTGTIRVDELLRPGGIYILPSIAVINTGDEPADYEIKVVHRYEQPQLKPLQEWFNFEPFSFRLEPGEVKNVAVKLTLPVKTTPGDYFALLEAHPVIKSEPGIVTIGVAAASKLYFTVVPANSWQGIYYRFISLYSRYHPWDTIVLVIIFLAILIVLFRRKFKIQIMKK